MRIIIFKKKVHPLVMTHYESIRSWSFTNKLWILIYSDPIYYNRRILRHNIPGPNLIWDRKKIMDQNPFQLYKIRWISPEINEHIRGSRLSWFLLLNLVLVLDSCTVVGSYLNVPSNIFVIDYIIADQNSIEDGTNWDTILMHGRLKKKREMNK